MLRDDSYLPQMTAGKMEMAATSTSHSRLFRLSQPEK